MRSLAGNDGSVIVQSLPNVSCRGLKFVMRADAGSSIGHGHRTRVECLARKVQELDGLVRLVSQPLSGARTNHPKLPDTVWIPRTADPRVDAQLTMSVLVSQGFRPDIAVVDSYLLGSEWEQEVAAQGVFVVAIDDFVGRVHSADLVIELVPNSGGSERVSGLRFFPIDPSFGLPPRPLPSRGWTVLVSFGASDPSGHTRIALEAIDLVDKQHEGLVSSLLVASNSTGADIEVVKALVDKTRGRQWVGHVPSLVPLVAQADVVITAAGNTLLESLAARKCVIAVVTAENQVAAMTSLVAEGVCISVGTASEATAERLAAAIVDLPRRLDSGMRSALSRCSIDTSGADRIVALIMESWMSRWQQ